jgi:glycerol-3-phosphate dehydrogenase
MVVALLGDAGLDLREGSTVAPLQPPVRFAMLSRHEQAALAQRVPAHRRIVCRCETVTEAEILEAIARGARTLDGLKFRTRAGMGRCQGGFSTSRCMGLLAQELDVPLGAVTKRGGGSWLVRDRHDVREDRGGQPVGARR